MNDYAEEILYALKGDDKLKFKKDTSKYLNGGTCPKCGEKDLYIEKSKLKTVYCSHIGGCGYKISVRDLYPGIFTKITEKYPATDKDPNRTANAYMSRVRGFPIKKIKHLFSQGYCPIPKKSPEEKQSFAPTVRFQMWDSHYWQRIIDPNDVESIGRKNSNSPDFSYENKGWQPPGQTIDKGDTVFIVEAIFHAIALWLIGKKVIAAFSCFNLPREIITQSKGKDIIWALAYDNDANGAGNGRTFKYIGELKKLGEKYLTYQCPQGKDWDDIYKQGDLNDGYLEECLLRGRVYFASNLKEKCYWQYFSDPSTYQVTDFRNKLYRVTINKKGIKESFGKGGDSHTQTDIEDDDSYGHSEAYKKQLKESGGFEAFKANLSTRELSNCFPQFKFQEEDNLTKERFYHFSIRYPQSKEITLFKTPGAIFESPAKLKSTLLKYGTGARFEGDDRDMLSLNKQWLDRKFPKVRTVDFKGYDSVSKAYVFDGFGFKDGRMVKPNEDGYFDFEESPVKSSLNMSILKKVRKETNTDWINNYITAFSYDGLAVLGFFFGSLFAEQISKKIGYFPFMEFTGEHGAGKTSVITFCWKLLGRENYEGFNPASSTPAARHRNYAQVSNLPIVLVEGDSEDNKKFKLQKVNWEEYKEFFNRKGIRARGVANNGNETLEVPFRGALVIMQNNTIDASGAILSRIVHCHATQAHHKPENKHLADWFREVEIRDVSGFLYLCLTNEYMIIETILKEYKKLLPRFMRNEMIKEARIAECHALVSAMVSGLKTVITSLDDDDIKSSHDHLLSRAINRQGRLSSDHPDVQRFWECFETANMQKVKKGEETAEHLRGGFKEALNHSHKPHLVAIRIEQVFGEINRLALDRFDQAEMRNLLKTSRKYKFLKIDSVKSKLDKTTRHCWIFKAPEGEEHEK